MTVPHADLSARAWPVVVAAAAGPAFFLAEYVVASHRSLPGGRFAAVAGLSAVLLLWSAALAWSALRAWSHRPPVHAALVPYAVLGWMVFDLLLEREPFGAWAAIAPVALLSGAVLLWAALRTAERADDSIEEPAGAPATPEAGTERLRVGVDSGFWAGVTATLSPQDAEQGGVALTTTVDGLHVVVGVVLPVQIAASAVWCEFAVADVERVREALDRLDPDVQERIGLSWLHTHPRLGVFLSPTDRNTSARWRSLDPGFRPIVVDVSKPVLTEQIGVFGADDRKIEPIGLVEDTVDLATAEILERAVLERYRRENAPAPTILIGPVRSGIRPRAAVGA